LGTREVAEAKRLAHEVALRVDEAFDRARKGEEAFDTLSASEAKQIAALWLSEEMDFDEELRVENVDTRDGEDALSDIYSQVLEGLENFPGRRSLSIVEQEITYVCEKHGLQLKKNSTDYRRIGLELLHAKRTWLEMIRDRNAGEWPEVPKPSSIPTSRGSVSETGSNTPTISAMLDAWLAERRPRLGTENEWRRAVRRWEELHGDTPVGAITKAQVSAFKDALLKAPARPPHDIRALPLPEMITAAASKGLSRVSPTAVNKTVNAIKSILGYAVRNGKIEVNPASGVSAIVPPKSEDEERQPFTPDQVCKVLEAALKEKRESDRWLPWMAAFMGARRDEMALARVSDIQTENGITYLRITDAGDGRSLKTKSSRRNVPLHSLLIQSGFLDYVEGLQKGGGLFPDLNTAAYTKRFARMLDKIGLDDPNLVLHSFRHTFKDACRAAGITEEVHDALTGHAGGGSGVGRSYGRGVPLDVLAGAVEKIGYPELRVSRP